MYDIEKLVGIVCDLLEAEADCRKYNLEIRKKKGYMPNTELWIPSLGGSEAYRLGELSERYDAVKSMQRKERHNGRWDNPNYTCWMNHEDKVRLAEFLAKDKGEHGYHSWYESTGRKKAWCA